MSEHAENLRHNLSMAFNFPPHLHDALRAWVDSVEERLTGGSQRETLSDRVAAVETAVADLHAALSDKMAPVGVRRAVADVEVPQPVNESNKPEDKK